MRQVTAAPADQPTSSREDAKVPEVPNVAAEASARAKPVPPASRCLIATPPLSGTVGRSRDRIRNE